MKATDLIHGGYYLLGGHKETVKFNALNGHFYTLDDRCIGEALVNADTGEVECLIQSSIWMKITPMPLTEEILKMNGFGFVGTHEWRDGIFVSTWRFCTEDYEHKISVLYTPEYDGFSWRGYDVNNVHQLQMALILCGLNDLAINLKVVED